MASGDRRRNQKLSCPYTSGFLIFSYLWLPLKTRIIGVYTFDFVPHCGRSFSRYNWRCMWRCKHNISNLIETHTHILKKKKTVHTNIYINVCIFHFLYRRVSMLITATTTILIIIHRVNRVLGSFIRVLIFFSVYRDRVISRFKNKSLTMAACVNWFGFTSIRRRAYFEILPECPWVFTVLYFVLFHVDFAALSAYS